MTVTLRDLKLAMTQTRLAKATPHRDVYWEKLEKKYGWDAQIQGQMMFIEEYNTGYGGVLERWMFRPVKDTGDVFWLDLLPGLIESGKPVEAEA